MRHVHIGPSPLALGLLIPCTLAAGFEVFLLGRPGDGGSCEYVQVNTKTKKHHPRQVHAFEGPDRFADLTPALKAAIESDEPLLLTSTLRQSIVERQDLVRSLMSARRDCRETIFVPCENDPHGAYDELEAQCKDMGGLPLRAVVNRMCRPADRDQGRRVVEAHPLGEWLIESPSLQMPLLDALAVVEEVEIVADYPAREDRKLWMVNGAHQALAVMAGTASVAGIEIADLRDAARRNDVIAQLAQLHGPMDEALRLRHPALKGNLKYAKSHVLAYAEHPDTVARVMKEFRREDLTPFIAKMEERLGRPAQICFEAGRSVEAFGPVFDFFEDLAKDLDAYSDAEQIRLRPELITQAADEQAVVAYRRLVAGWTSTAEAAERVQCFADALRDSGG